MKKIVYTFLATALFFSCERDEIGVVPVPVQMPEEVVTPVDYTSGSANFSNFVSVGNSLTAGYSDRALFKEGQENSFPNMLAQQMQLAGGGSFDIPYMNDNLGGLLLGGNVITNNRMFLDFSSGSPTPNFVSGTPTTEITNTLSGNFNNMGVPGAKSYHLLAPGYGNVAGVQAGLANPYFVRFASSPTATVIEDAVSQAPSFFSLWIGNNDILGFATSGGAGVDQTGNFDPATYGSNDITDPTVFAGVYSGLLDALTTTTTDGIVSNIPSVVDIPFFTTVPYNAIPLDQATADMLNAAFAPYNGGLLQIQQLGAISAEEVARRTVNFVAGQNAVLMLDEDLTDLTIYNPQLTNMRQATADDLVVFTASTFLGTLVNDNPTLINGVSVPLDDSWVLTPEEQEMIETARVQYNATIETLAGVHNIAFYDAAFDLNQLNNGGITMDGITSTGIYATGGAFSLDGVHPSPRGYSIIANGMIDVINAKYGSNLPKVNVGDYKGVYVN